MFRRLSKRRIRSNKATVFEKSVGEVRDLVALQIYVERAIDKKSGYSHDYLQYLERLAEAVDAIFRSVNQLDFVRVADRFAGKRCNINFLHDTFVVNRFRLLSSLLSYYEPQLLRGEPNSEVDRRMDSSIRATILALRKQAQQSSGAICHDTTDDRVRELIGDCCVEYLPFSQVYNPFCAEIQKNMCSGFVVAWAKRVATNELLTDVTSNYDTILTLYESRREFESKLTMVAFEQSQWLRGSSQIKASLDNMLERLDHKGTFMVNFTPADRSMGHTIGIRYWRRGEDEFGIEVFDANLGLLHFASLENVSRFLSGYFGEEDVTLKPIKVAMMPYLNSLFYEMDLEIDLPRAYIGMRPNSVHYSNVTPEEYCKLRSGVAALFSDSRWIGYGLLENALQDNISRNKLVCGKNEVSSYLVDEIVEKIEDAEDFYDDNLLYLKQEFFMLFKFYVAHNICYAQRLIKQGNIEEGTKLAQSMGEIRGRPLVVLQS